MRILTGKYKGRKIRTLDTKELRPTSTLVREALFNILTHNEIFTKNNFFAPDKVFLEVFCGSGIISFEMLSRGIKKAILLDYNPKLKELFNINKSLLQNDEQSDFILCDLEKKFPPLPSKIDICFLDPPYHKNIIPLTLNHLITNNYLNKDAIIIIESDKRNQLNYQEYQLKLLLEKTYGKSRLTFTSF